MSTFVNITLDEFRDFLKLEKGWQEFVVNKEVVFDFPLRYNPNIKIRVFSSISTDSNTNRDVGKDAIRICAVDTLNNRGFIFSIRCNRTTNWRTNLKDKIYHILGAANVRARS